MIRSRYIVSYRNKLNNLAGEMDSPSAIEDSKCTVAEREWIQEHLRIVINYLDKRLL